MAAKSRRCCWASPSSLFSSNFMSLELVFRIWGMLAKCIFAWNCLFHYAAMAICGVIRYGASVDVNYTRPIRRIGRGFWLHRRLRGSKSPEGNSLPSLTPSPPALIPRVPQVQWIGFLSVHGHFWYFTWRKRLAWSKNKRALVTKTDQIPTKLSKNTENVTNSKYPCQ